MPTSVIAAIAGAAVSSAVSTAIGTGFLGTFIGGVAGALTSAVVGAAFSDNEAPSTPAFETDAANTLVTVRQTAAPWQIVYGQRRVGGTYAFIHGSAVNSSGTVQATESHVVPEGLSITVTQGANFAAAVAVTVRTWDPTNEAIGYVETPLTLSATIPPGPGEYYAAAGVYTFNAAQVGASVQITYTFNQVQAGSTSNYMHVVIVLAAHECEEIGDIYFNDELVPLDGNGNATGRFANHVRVLKHLGATAQAADTTLIAEAPGKWTTNHRLRGKAYIYVRLVQNRDLFPAGIPNISAVVKGRKVYDPRSTLTAWSANAALCISDYLTNADFGLGADYATEIDETQLIAAANECDEAVTLAAGGTEARYTCNGAFSLGAAPREQLGRLLTSMAGTVRYIGGLWRIHPAAYATPTVTLTADDLRGPVRISPRLSRRDLANGVKGIYVSPDQDWQPTDFPPVTNATYLTEDQGERIWRELDLPFTTSAATAQRIAKIELERVRQQVTLSLACKLTAYQVQPGDTVMVTLARYGYSAKVFEVTNAALVHEDDGAGGIRLGVDLTLRETASTVFDWTSGEETEVDPAPDTSLPSPWVVGPPASVSVSSGEDELLVGGDGTVLSRMRIAWPLSADGSVTSGGAVIVQYRISGAAEWIEAQSVPGWATQTWAVPVVDGELYEARARFVNAIGVRSEWTQTTHTVIGKTEPPEDVPWFSINGTTLAWGEVSDVDVAGYRIRYMPGVNFSWGNAVPLHTGLVTAPPFVTSIVTGGQVTLLIKAVDTSGNESENVAYIVTDLGDPLVANVVETIDLDALGYPGTIVHGAVDAGDLKANDASDLMWNEDSSAQLWAYDSSLMWSGQFWYAMYDIAQITPREAGVGSRMTLAHTIAADNYSIEYRRNGPEPMWKAVDTELMWSSDAASFWTLPPGDFPATMWTGDSNLQWAADSSKLMWTVLEGGFQTWPGAIDVLDREPYDIRVTTGFGTTRGVVSALTFTVDMPDIVERFDDVVISSGGTRLPITQTYREISNVLITVQNDGNGAVGARIEDKDASSGPLVKTINDAGTAVTGLVDATIQGF